MKNEKKDKSPPTAMNRKLDIKRFVLATFAALPVHEAWAKCGGVDYSWGAAALATMHDYVVTAMLYVLYLLYAIAGIVAVYASLQIYIKMNVGEQGVMKEILMVVGACLFIIGASVVFPAVFGYMV